MTADERGPDPVAEPELCGAAGEEDREGNKHVAQCSLPTRPDAMAAQRLRLRELLFHLKQTVAMSGLPLRRNDWADPLPTPQTSSPMARARSDKPRLDQALLTQTSAPSPD